MKKILVPTDFSQLGDFAYGVAHKLANYLKAEITALSVVQGPPGAFYSPTGELTADDGEDYSEWHKKLAIAKEKLAEWTKDKPLVEHSVATIGKIDETILRTSKLEDIDLIVMGTDGVFENPVWSKGSHTEYIMGHSEVPVLSLKCDRDNIDLRRIVLVGDFLVPAKINLDVLKSIQGAFDSTIILLKIKSPGQIRSDEQINTDMEAFAKANDLHNFEMHTYSDNSVEAGIGKFTAEKDIDLIAIGTHQAHGFSKLFRGSISEDVVNHLYHPILTFPI